jgi:hypothetical protein
MEKIDRDKQMEGKDIQTVGRMDRQDNQAIITMFQVVPSQDLTTRRTASRWACP